MISEIIRDQGVIMDQILTQFLGKTIAKIEGLHKGSDEVVFTLSDGRSFQMFHEQDCCENVKVEDVNGEPEDIIGSPILVAEENTNRDDPPLNEYDESHTWTFYRLRTMTGTVVIRWYGTSNGYYSESVSIIEV